MEDRRTWLKVLRRDLANDPDVETRAEIVRSLETARSAAQILATRKAEHDAAERRLRALDDLRLRYEGAATYRDSANAALTIAKEKRGGLANDLEAAKEKVETARVELSDARQGRQEAKLALAAGQQQAAAYGRRAAVLSAKERHGQLLKLEAELSNTREVASTSIPAATIAELEKGERAIAEARAVLAAGSTTIELTGRVSQITIDGDPFEPGERTLTRETRIALGGDAELVVRPPSTVASAEARLMEATHLKS